MKYRSMKKRSVPCKLCGAPVFWTDVEPEEPLCKSCIEKINQQTTEWLRHSIKEAEKKLKHLLSE